MLKCTCEIVGISPISFSAPIQSIKNTGENHDAFEERTWRERLHVDDKGVVYIPPMALKNCLTSAAQFLGETIRGKGKSTYTKHFRAGIMCTDPMDLGVKGADVPGERLFVPSDGKTGGGSRVWKTFPTIQKWRTTVTFYAIDPVLIDEPAKIAEYLAHAGMFIGLGRFRPQNGGFYGRFKVEGFKSAKMN